MSVANEEILLGAVKLSNIIGIQSIGPGRALWRAAGKAPIQTNKIYHI